MLKHLENKTLEEVNWELEFLPSLSVKVSLRQFIHAIVKYFDVPTHKIRSLNVANCQKVTDSDLNYALKNLPNLVEINLTVSVVISVGLLSHHFPTKINEVIRNVRKLAILVLSM